MSQNLVQLNLTAEQLQQAAAAVDTLETVFAGLIDLQPADRQALTKMGGKSEAFCRETLHVLQQKPRVITPNLRLQDALDDLRHLDALRPLITRLTSLLERAKDTEMALGSDVMSAALEGYALLKISGEGEGLNNLRDAVSVRFARRRPVEAPATPVAGP